MPGRDEYSRDPVEMPVSVDSHTRYVVISSLYRPGTPYIDRLDDGVAAGSAISALTEPQLYLTSSPSRARERESALSSDNFTLI